MATSTPNTLDNPTIAQLEKATGLPINGDVLTIFKTAFLPNKSKYAASLEILIKGHDAINETIKVDGSDSCTITDKFYNQIITLIELNGLQQAVANTPAGSKMINGPGNIIVNMLQSIGLLGSFSRYSANNSTNVMTGPSVHSPCLMDDLLNTIHPGMVDEIENACNVIRTHSFLSLPSDAMGSINQAMWYITGAVNALYSAIINLYMGLQAMIQQFYAGINALIGIIQSQIISLIEQFVDLELICAILGAVQTVLDDIGFFAMMFNGSDQLFQTLNSIQTVVNYASFGVNFAYNPIGGLETLFPQQAQQVFNFINMVQSMPQVFLSKLMSHIGFGTISQNRGLQIANAIVQQFGLGAQLGPLGPVLASAGLPAPESKWYRTGNTGIRIGGNTVYNYMFSNPMTGGVLDVNLNPLGGPAQSSAENFV